MLAGASRRHRPVFSGVLSNYFHFFPLFLFRLVTWWVHFCQGRVVFLVAIFLFFGGFGQGEAHFSHKVTLFFPFLPGGEGHP